MYRVSQQRKVQGSITVEAAIIVPVILLCIFWLIQRGIALYEDTITIVEKQEMWDEFEPVLYIQQYGCNGISGTDRTWIRFQVGYVFCNDAGCF